MAKLLIPEQITIRAKQPEKCKSCLWGRWDGMKQYCSKLMCIKD